MTMTPGMMNFVLYWMPCLSFVFTAFMPACLQISFATATGLSVIQARLLRDRDFREYVGIAPLPVSKSRVIDVKPKINLAPIYQTPGPVNEAPAKPAGLVGGVVYEGKRTVSEIQDWLAKKVTEGRAQMFKQKAADRKERGREYERRRRREIEDKRRNRY